MIEAAKFDSVLADLMDGVSVLKSCKKQRLARRDFYVAVAADETLADRYAQARTIGLDRIADDIIDIADQVKACPKSRAVRVDARKWFLAKMAPKKYGDKIQTEHSGSVNVTTVDYANAIKE